MITVLAYTSMEQNEKDEVKNERSQKQVNNSTSDFYKN